MARQRRTSSTLEDPPSASAPALTTLSWNPPVSEKTQKPHSKRRKARSLLRRWKQISIRHTWLNPLLLVLTILAAYAVNPTPSNPLHSAIFLSYPLPRGRDGGPQMYGKGRKDLYFVGFYTIVLSFTREFLMQRFIRPLAIRSGLRSRAKVYRFMEQVYTAIYFVIFGPIGLYVMSKSPLWYFETKPMFEGFPHRQHSGEFKVYYLLQAAYWSQQAIVLILQLEKPRKDYKGLVFHHLITLLLIGLSYRFHFAHMGLAVYITHDVSDLFLATSKTLNYIDSPITGPFYALFVCVWIYLRHYLNLRILWATLTEFRSVGPFELNWETQQYKCWISQYITFSLLACLQAVNLFWLFLILRIAKNYVFSGSATDDRSDDEGEDDTIEEVTEVAKGQEANTPKVLVNGHATSNETSSQRTEAVNSRKRR
ncbi:MAG: hypothetical protein Q9227_005514 [Pyrenula ochraceoflavens]